MAKIYYVGDWAILTGPTFAESPFQFAPKGLEIILSLLGIFIN